MWSSCGWLLLPKVVSNNKDNFYFLEILLLVSALCSSPWYVYCVRDVAMNKLLLFYNDTY